ncbi:hypothetical protein POG22_01455 [Geitlerinema sp. CS-897]|nr:hypothetical protein [Geitlerinema sp. CS-897]
MYPDNLDADWHPGYNLFSTKSVSTYLQSLTKVDSFHFVNFSEFPFPFDIEPQDDPVRSWTYKDSNGVRRFRNGIMPLDFKFLVIELS